jgi:hypothetical protein
LREKHWPLGLLYGCYAHPSFSIEATNDNSVDIGVLHNAVGPRATGAGPKI